MSRIDRVMPWVVFILQVASGCLLLTKDSEWRQFAPACWFCAALSAAGILLDYYAPHRKPPSQ